MAATHESGDAKPTDGRVWRVVINHEEQYSIWPVDRELPLGWRDGEFQGSREQCLEHVDKVWTDMRPLSVRKALGEA